jgi:hypothetical protein
MAVTAPSYREYLVAVFLLHNHENSPDYKFV